MTKEQALQILQEAIDRGIDPDEDVEIFDAIKIAIEWLQSDPNAPDWSQAPDWAEWYAIDADGQCFWYENEPVKRGNNFFPSSGVEKLHYQKRAQTLYKRPE